MRRLLISLGLAAAVGGVVLGAAATLNIGPTTLGAGATVVASCDTDGINATLEPSGWTDTPGVFVYIAHFTGVADACLNRPAVVTLTMDGVALDTADYYYWYGGGADDNTLQAYFDPFAWANAVDVNDLHLLIK